VGDFEDRLSEGYAQKLRPDLTVRRARNGWILRLQEGQVEVIEEADADPWGLGLLRAVQEFLGLTGSRYDPDRIVIKTEPGDKHHDIHPLLCRACACKCDPDRSTRDEP
jgi:hypothetical protein